ncbi:MAG: DUF1573 domain-containing protein [Flammeovirgaceae bacterium]
MKKLFFVLFLGLFATTTFAQDSESGNEKQATITFEESSHDFGDITQGDQVQYVFKFNNTGTAPLVLTNVATTCGCTAPTWPREAILPGEAGEILIKFNSAGKMGNQTKVITIYSNASNNPARVKIVTNILAQE